MLHSHGSAPCQQNIGSPAHNLPTHPPPTGYPRYSEPHLYFAFVVLLRTPEHKKAWIPLKKVITEGEEGQKRTNGQKT